MSNSAGISNGVDPVVKNRIANLRAVDCVVEQALFCFFL